MLQSFTRNYYDNSTDAGFEFTFYCDHCNDGVKSSFIESETAKKKKGLGLFGQAISIGTNLIGGKIAEIGNSAERGSNVLSQRFDGQSPEWMKEHEQAFTRAQNEAKQHFHRCPNDAKYVCDACWNEDEGLCVGCAPRQEIYVAQAKAQAMLRNINEAASTATVWQGAIESKTTICPDCGKPTGAGKYCNNCGASLDLRECPRCGAKNSLSVRYCNNCGENLEKAEEVSGKCSDCGFENPPGTKFCGECGKKL